MAANLEHESFPQPSQSDTPLWRYMSFAKFVSMLSTESLHFSRLDYLGDPFEGSVPPANLPLRQELLSGIEDGASTLSRFRKNACQYAFVNCWHMGEHESAAMWNLYAGVDAGIAIRTDYASLASVLPQEVFFGMVTYVDYTRDAIPEGNALTPYMYKRLSFAHEREVRALIWDLPLSQDGQTVQPEHPLTGKSVEIDLAGFIRGIYVNPAAPGWYLAAASDAAIRYGLEAEVRKSSLDLDPTY